MSETIDRLVRDNIRSLTPYSSARTEFSGAARIFLDANENAFGSPIEYALSRYPDPDQCAVREGVAHLYGVRPSQVFIGNGSDEAIDLLFRVFCRPQIDSVILCPPTYGMYEVSASINDVAVKKVELRADFDLDVDGILRVIDPATKLIFLCSPNNPTGNLLDRSSVIELLKIFQGLVVVDEAYIDFANATSFVSSIDEFENLVVLKTFSKAWGLAGLRVGMAFASEQIIAYLRRTKPPYNVGGIAQSLVLDAIDNKSRVQETVAGIVAQREFLAMRLAAYRSVYRVYPSATNFLLVKVRDAQHLYRFLLDQQIVVRDRSGLANCAGCLRITVGTEAENTRLLEAFEIYEKSFVY